ncbi:MAG: GNAT family N-acetyltransferase [Micromonosporaceae bacterium]|nr:GNAT family N-acetyltransferase [Micromonosporaceae bacterium]
MSMIKKLIGTRISLAPMTSEYADLLATWFNDLEVAIPTGDEAWQTITPDGMRERLASSQHDFLIVAHDEAGDTPIGRCLLFAVNHIDRTAMLGICLGDKRHWNRGLGGEAIELLLDYAFNLLNLNSVMLGVFAFNARAISCYRRVGFREIGHRRQARLIAGKYHDAILMDLLAEDFTGHRIRDLVGPA